MGKKYYSRFIRADTAVKDKDKAITNFVKYWINRCNSMFKYFGLPDSIPQFNLELYLLTQGHCFITQVDGVLYALSGNFGGEYNAYFEPTLYTVSNPALNITKNYNIDSDGVICKSDSMCNGLLPLLEKYGTMLTELDISIRSATINTRLQTIISAPDDRTKASAELYLKRLLDGDISVIGENSFFDGVKVHNTTTTGSYINQLIELNQYLKASLYNELGLNANYNMKREYIGNQESALNDDVLLPLCDDMLKNRKIFCEKVNNKYGTNISVEYDSSWKLNDSEQEKQVAINSQINSDDSKNEDLEDDDGKNDG
jgi:hypothetical protein